LLAALRYFSVQQVKHMGPTISDSLEPASAIRHLDVTHSKRDASLDLLVRELQHRIRNLLTVVQCFVNNTEANTADDYRVALMARIVNLSDAYNLIENARENRVSLAELLERTLMPHATFLKDRLFAAGPDIVLEPRLALSIHMIFHELATNASKHGALTSTSGAVEVLWDVRSDGEDHTLVVQWREHGGPEVREPRHKGFGLRLISKVLSGAQVEMDFAPAGLLCRLLVKIDPS
jgi:two-component sensor histidine kinase